MRKPIPLNGILCVLVGSTTMDLELFEAFREWVRITRRRKGSIKLPIRFDIGSARSIRVGGRQPGYASDEIILRPEPAVAEFIAELRSSEASWPNIKQLTEPHSSLASSSLQDRYRP